MDDEDYEVLVRELKRGASGDFRNACGSAKEQRRACCRFLKRGRLAHISQAELIDFLGVSTPSVLEMAGYSGQEAQCVMDMLAHISENEIEGVEI